jgi:hypothetical protein
MRVYWWVTGGWSSEGQKPFKDLELNVAVSCAAIELANKSAAQVGLFAAPALLALILERGRSSAVGDLTFENIALAPSLSWRKSHFSETASGPLAALLPITAALGIAAISDDAEDWKPRFKRLTNLDPGAELKATECSVQLYRERLVASALA